MNKPTKIQRLAMVTALAVLAWVPIILLVGERT